jgi:D-serine deaminase-like pyridoxal phosphate-dependent protein
MQLAAGAHGITCAKVSEAEVYAASGVHDILIANQIVGPIKTRRVAHLARHADIAVAVDAFDNVLEHEAAASESRTSPRLLIEINCGTNRAGVEPGERAVDLVKQIAALKHVRLGGVMTWEGHTLSINEPERRQEAILSALAPVLQTVRAIRLAGIEVPIVSCGGTGTLQITAGIDGVTEVQAGGGIFGDRFYRDLGVPVHPALSLLVTVTSRPTPYRIIIDAGRKSVDPSNVVPEVIGLQDVNSLAFSAEHGTVELSAPNMTVKVGDRLRLNIGYSDQAVHLHEQLIVLNGGTIEAVWPTYARGRLQ